jgi:hypothetical protein
VSIGQLAGIEADAALVRIGAGPSRRARTAVTLRNLKDPVVVVEAGADGLIIIGQLFAGVTGGLDMGAGAISSSRDRPSPSRPTSS